MEIGQIASSTPVHFLGHGEYFLPVLNPASTWPTVSVDKKRPGMPQTRSSCPLHKYEVRLFLGQVAIQALNAAAVRSVNDWFGRMRFKSASGSISRHPKPDPAFPGAEP